MKGLTPSRFDAIKGALAASLRDAGACESPERLAYVVADRRSKKYNGGFLGHLEAGFFDPENLLELKKLL